ncbi:MAG: deoxyribonuclease IV, partial [Actinomycetota bacterium]|nr:deoxyribonuclease IV [Actinomycetota bacterium]
MSPAGGPANAVARGEERGAEAIQFFNQNPRAWRAREYTDEEVEAYRAALEASEVVQALVIHAVYLINCASLDGEIRRKSLNSLTIALRSGAALGARGVVLHAGSALLGADHDTTSRAVTRAAEVIREALAESQDCPLHLENTAGSGGTLGRSFHELAALIEQAGGDGRLGLCLDSCHLWASGFDVSGEEALAEVIDDCVEIVGVERLGSLHVNDSKTPLGSNVDRHAPLGEGEIGRAGLEAFLSEPRFDGLPVIFEGPGVEGKAPARGDVELMRELREAGLA